MRPPSFEAWLGRVKVAKATFTVLGFVLVAAMGYSAGQPIDDALLRGLVAAVACYFVGWAAALWVCGELHANQIVRLRDEFQRHEIEKREQLQSLYEQRATAMGDYYNAAAAIGTPTEPMQAPPAVSQQPPQRRAA